MKTFACTVLLLIGITSLASAQAGTCNYEGRAYPVGTVLGPFVCTEQGWQPK